MLLRRFQFETVKNDYIQNSNFLPTFHLSSCSSESLLCALLKAGIGGLAEGGGGTEAWSRGGDIGGRVWKLSVSRGRCNMAFTSRIFSSTRPRRNAGDGSLTCREDLTDDVGSKAVLCTNLSTSLALRIGREEVDVSTVNCWFKALLFSEVTVGAGSWSWISMSGCLSMLWTSFKTFEVGQVEGEWCLGLNCWRSVNLHPLGCCVMSSRGEVDLSINNCFLLSWNAFRSDANLWRRRSSCSFF